MIKKKQSLIDLLCCMCDSDGDTDERVNLRNSQQGTGELKSSKNELVLLGDPNEYYCLARITQKNFFVDMLQRKKNTNKEVLRSTDIGNIYFSLYDSGIQVEYQDFTKLLPEKVLKYLVRRAITCNNCIIWDAFCQYGSFSIQAAAQEEVLYVVALNENHNNLQKSVHNAVNVYKRVNEIDFIQASFEKIRVKHSQPDTIFIYLESIYNEKEQFDLCKHIKPPIGEIITAATKCCKNQIYVLPKQANFQEIAIIFSYYFKQNNLELNKFEIQIIQVDGLVTNFIVYIGDVAMLQNQDEKEFISNYLLQDTQKQGIYQNCFQVVNVVQSKIGLRRLLRQIILSFNECKEQSQTILAHFLNNIIQENLLTQNQIEEIFGKEELDNLIQQTPQYRQLSLSEQSFKNENFHLNNEIKPKQQKPQKKSRVGGFHSFSVCDQVEQNMLVQENISLMAMLKLGKNDQFLKGDSISEKSDE